jgi:chemotaxis methyl-accepting protein methylase
MRVCPLFFPKKTSNEIAFNDSPSVKKQNNYLEFDKKNEIINSGINEVFAACYNGLFNQSVSFKSTDKITDSFNISTTSFFRDESLWNDLPEYLAEKFPDGTQIYCYACSDGSEPYTLALKLIDKFGEKKAAKFLPIHAFDTDSEIISTARAGIVGLEDSDIQKIKQYSKNYTFEELFTEIDDSEENSKIDGIKAYKISEKLRKLVKFECADVTEDAEKAHSDPCIIIVRNVWYLLNSPKRKNLAKDLSENLKPGSVLIVGKCESSSYYKDLIIDNGFTPANIATKNKYPYIYEIN